MPILGRNRPPELPATFASFWMMSGRPIMKPVRTPGAISFVNEHMNSVRSGASE